MIAAVKTIVVNLFGGPGIGKSTLAAEVFAGLKSIGVNCELVTEYVKKWAWEGRPISTFDQLYIFAKQLRAESQLYGKVNVIVTDSPFLLSPIYESIYGQGPSLTHSPSQNALVHALDAKVTHLNFVLPRIYPYDVQGRYETEQKALEIDKEILHYLTAYSIPFCQVPTSNQTNYINSAVLEKLYDTSSTFFTITKPRSSIIAATPRVSCV